MALTDVSLRVNQNTFQRGLLGDLVTVIFDVTVDGNPNAYPSGGEPIDFSSQFLNAHFVMPTVGIANPSAPDTNKAIIPMFQRASVNTGVIRFFQSGAVNTNLEELAVGGYPNGFLFSIMVFGQPATDQS